MKKIYNWFNYLAKYNTLKFQYERDRKSFECINAEKDLQIDKLKEQIKDYKDDINDLKKQKENAYNKFLEKKYKNVRAE